MRTIQLIALFLCTSFLLSAQESTDPDVLSVIRKYSMDSSQVAETASWITDVYGPRLTGSPMLDKATAWALSEMDRMGMKNVHLEQWGPFGRGWELEHFEMHANSGGYWPVIAFPKAWSSSGSGEGEVIYLDAKTVDDLKQYEGKLHGKFVMMDTIRVEGDHMDPLAERYEAEDLLNLANKGLPQPRQHRNYRGGNSNWREFRDARWALLESEKPLALLDRSYKGDLGTIFVQQASSGTGNVRDSGRYVIPQVTLGLEHYNRIFRLLKKGIPVTMSFDLQTKYTNDDGEGGMENNIIAEIPGTDLADEVVMFGGHFDSWQSSTGATDNGVGCAVMMEVARILLETIRETGIQPRRTLRVALWTGEEQGIYGSRNYVADHYAYVTGGGWSPDSLRPDNQKISAYYNLDNGTGKIRGIYMQGNDQLVNLFREWLDPFKDDGASTISLGNTGGTDHLPFAAAGIPAFQFIQDPMAYGTRTHHSNMDCWDMLSEDDMKQAATIIAWFVWNTAQRDAQLPRKGSEMVR